MKIVRLTDAIQALQSGINLMKDTIRNHALRVIMSKRMTELFGAIRIVQTGQPRIWFKSVHRMPPMDATPVWLSTLR